MQTALGKLISQSLDRQEIERARLAQELHVTPVSVSRWLRPEGDSLVPWKHYLAISTFLHIPIETVLRAAEKDAPNHVRQFKAMAKLFQQTGT